MQVKPVDVLHRVAEHLAVDDGQSSREEVEEGPEIHQFPALHPSTVDIDHSYGRSVEEDDIEKQTPLCLDDDTVQSVMGLAGATLGPFKHCALEPTTFTLTTSEWDTVQSIRGHKHFERFAWQELFASKVRESNPYCIIRFVNHYFSTSVVRKSDKPCLTIIGACRHPSCAMTFKIHLNSFEDGIFHIQ